MNKRNSLKIQSEAYDVVRQMLWSQTIKNPKADKKKIEKMLVDMDDSLFFNYQMLHDIIQGKDAQYIQKIRPDGMVLMGHQHQAVYFSLTWDDIHKLSAEIKAFEKELAEEKADIIRKHEEQLLQIKAMLKDRLITNQDADRYLKALEMPEHVTPEWLKHHMMSYEELEDMAGTKLARKWEKNHQVKSPKVLSKP